MRQDDDGRDTVPAWSITQRVFGAIDNCPGTVVSVDATADTFSVQWADQAALGGIVYPSDTIMVRPAFPWEK